MLPHCVVYRSLLAFQLTILGETKKFMTEQNQINMIHFTMYTCQWYNVYKPMIQWLLKMFVGYKLLLEI